MPKVLAPICKRLGLPAPRPRQRAWTWVRACVRSRAQPHRGRWSTNPEEMSLAEEWYDEACRHFELGWQAARQKRAEECERMLRGGITMVRVGNNASMSEENGGDGVPTGRLASIVQARRSDGLVVWAVDEDGDEVPEWLWSEAFGLHAKGYMLDDGHWREGFADARDAAEAAATWAMRKKGPGRGLPYVDTERRRAQRVAIADDPEASPDVLRELCTDPCREVHEALAQNPSLPEDALGALAEHCEMEALCMLAQRHDLPPRAVKAIVDCEVAEPTAFLLGAGNAQPEALHKLQEDPELPGLVEEQDTERFAPEVRRILERRSRGR